MKLYQPSGITRSEDANFPWLTMAIPYEIEFVQVKADILRMTLRYHQHAFAYALFGKEVFKPFMEEMRVESVDDLVGKEIFAYISPKEFATSYDYTKAQGLSVIK